MHGRRDGQEKSLVAKRLRFELIEISRTLRCECCDRVEEKLMLDLRKTWFGRCLLNAYTNSGREDEILSSACAKTFVVKKQGMVLLEFRLICRLQVGQDQIHIHGNLERGDR